MNLESSVLTKLSDCYLFTNITPVEIGSILSDKHIRIRNFDTEQYAVRAGDACIELPLLITGNVRGEMTESSGKVVKIEDLKAPAVLASAFLFGYETKFPVDVIANEPSCIFFIPKELLLKLFQDKPQIMLNFLNDISNRSQFLSRKIKFLAFKTIREKLAHYLTELSVRQNSDTVMVPIIHSRLADFFGVTRPSLGRAIAELERERIIQADRNQIKILNKMKLIELSNR
jgi:CRP/FNR family transcriptional regulator, dissimilatory nitrate respiration regulator